MGQDFWPLPPQAYFGLALALELALGAGCAVAGDEGRAEDTRGSFGAADGAPTTAVASG